MAVRKDMKNNDNQNRYLMTGLAIFGERESAGSKKRERKREAE